MEENEPLKIRLTIFKLEDPILWELLTAIENKRMRARALMGLVRTGVKVENGMVPAIENMAAPSQQQSSRQKSHESLEKSGPASLHALYQEKAVGTILEMT